MATKRTRAGERLSLEVAGLETGPSPAEPVRAPAMPWLAAAVAGGAVAALSGWLLVVAPVVLAWLTTPRGGLPAALRLGTQMWLLGHGAGATLDKLHITLVPLGLSAVFALILLGVGGWAARQAQLVFPDDDLPAHVRQRVSLRVGLALASSYGASVGVASFLASSPQQTARALAGGVVLGGLAGTVGAARAVRWRPTAGWPLWLRLVPRSAAAAVLVLVIASCAVLVTGLWRHASRIAGLSATLGADPAGQLTLLALQLAYLPNLMLWCGSWLLGPGFSLGDGSVVSPLWTQVGLLPAVPVAAAVPEASEGRWVNLWWMLGGVAAGVAAAVVAGRRRVRFDEQALVGGVAGVVGGFVFTGLALLSRGDLGAGRLVGLGPRAVELAVMGPTLLGLSGMTAGLALGLLRPPPAETADGFDPSLPLPDGEDTRALERRDPGRVATARRPG